MRSSSYSVVAIPGIAADDSDRYLTVEEQVLRFAESFKPDVVLVHGCSARLLATLNARYPTASFVHLILCAGGKLFRRQDQVCTHRISPRCLVDWYAGPCGSSKSPLVAWRAYRRSRDYIAALRQLPRVIVASNFMRGHLVEEGIEPGRIVIAADFSTGIPVQTPLRRVSGDDNINLLFVGRVVYTKGIQYALRALTLLNERYRLIVVGEGWYLDRLKQLARELNLEHRVEFTGFLQGAALEERYQQASVAVVPSLCPEGAGLVVPEARGRGLPVAAFRVGGLAEWPDKYDGVYLAEPADATSLARAISDAVHSAPSLALRGGGVAMTTPEEAVEQILQNLANWRMIAA